MANIKISDLTAASVAADANEFEINEAGTSKKVTGSQIKAYVNSADGALASKDTVATADIDADAIDGTKIADDAIDAEHIADNAVGAAALNVAGTGTAGQALTSDGDGSFSWANAGGFFTTSVTMTGNTTATSSDNGKVYYTATADYVLTLPAPPGGNDTIAFGVINDSTGDLVVSADDTATEYIGDYLGSAIIPTKKEAIIVSIGSNWKVIALDPSSPLSVVKYTSSGSYTPSATVSAFLVAMGGSTYGAYGNNNTSISSGGGGYVEKLYASPSGTYNFTLGAGGATGSAGGTSTFDTNVIVNGASTSGGTASGGDWNVSGGNAGSGNGGNGRVGGGGGGAGRAGIGGNGANSVWNGANGGGGGTGGNNASGPTGGAAATSEDASAYGLSALIANFNFAAGGNGSANQTWLGGNGATGNQYYVDLNGANQNLEAGGGGRAGNFASYTGNNANLTIIEFKG